MVKFTWSLKDGDGVRATGKSPTMQIQRSSDSYYWTGSAWQAGSIDLNMSEFGKGIYYYNFTGTLQDLFIFFDESTIPRYSEAFYSLSDLAERLDGLNRKITDVVLNTDGSVQTSTWKFSATSSFASPVATFNLTYTYDANGKLTDVEIIKA
jgi:hypothetical protein